MLGSEPGYPRHHTRHPRYHGIPIIPSYPAGITRTEQATLQTQNLYIIMSSDDQSVRTSTESQPNDYLGLFFQVGMSRVQGQGAVEWVACDEGGECP